jgi:hypothetical protein
VYSADTKGRYLKRMASNESIGFRITAFVVVTLLAAFLIAVLIYLNQIKSCASCCLTTSEINTLLVIGGILFALTLLFWVWLIVRLFFGRKPKKPTPYVAVPQPVPVAVAAPAAPAPIAVPQVVSNPPTYIPSQPSIPVSYAANQDLSQTFLSPTYAAAQEQLAPGFGAFGGVGYQGVPVPTGGY